MDEENGLLMETEEIEAEEEPFLVEDTESEKACLTCSSYRVGTKVCGMFKARQIFRLSKGYSSDEDTFSCEDYIAE